MSLLIRQEHLVSIQIYYTYKQPNLKLIFCCNFNEYIMTCQLFNYKYKSYIYFVLPEEH